MYKGPNLVLFITVPEDNLAPDGHSSSADAVMTTKAHVDGLALDCSNPSALAMELLQSCTKPPMCFLQNFFGDE